MDTELFQLPTLFLFVLNEHAGLASLAIMDSFLSLHFAKLKLHYNEVKDIKAAIDIAITEDEEVVQDRPL